MTLIIQKPTGAKVVLRQTWQPMDSDAAAYITAVETADGQALEEKTKIAIDNFVLGCKADGIWSAIKASCILAGARTLTGALVPLVGVAPTNNNFVSGDYNRKTGLVGNGSTKYLSSNRAANADPQNSAHLSVYRTSTESFTDKTLIGSFNSNAGSYLDFRASAYNSWRFVINGPGPSPGGVPTDSTLAGFIGAQRAASASNIGRISGANYTVTNTSAAPGSVFSHLIFGRWNGVSSIVDNYSNARLAFYSIGEALDLARLDARVTDLINAFGAAIP
jgi:hypothetical protein